MKVCNKCGNLGEFYASRPSRCKVCICAEVSARRLANPEKIKAEKKRYNIIHAVKHRAKTKAWREANPERHKEANRKWREQNKERIRTQNVCRVYNISPERFLELSKKQNGKCAICRMKPTTKRGLHVDHHHETGVVRGLLCSRCNTGIGMLFDNTIMLKRAIRYLRSYHKEIYRDL